MMEKLQGAKIRIAIIAAAVFIIMAAVFVLASGTAPYFNPTPPSVITCYQNSTCFYDFNATDDESDPINFSIDTPPFSENIDADTGVMNFTPTNEQVGVYSNTWAIVKETDTGNGTFKLINWNIININDKPNITSHFPEKLTNITVKENFWISLNVTADDPDLIHDDTLNYTWTLDGILNKSLLNYTDNIANYTPDFFSAGLHNITVNVTDNQSAWDSITWEVNVTNENRAPINNDTIPNITMQEDTPQLDEINLTDYFYDNDTDDYPMVYDVVFVGQENLTVLINTTEPNNVSFIPDNNFFGINTVRFSCFDGYNTTYSEQVSINVTGVNDDPVVTQVTNKTAYAGTLFQLQIQASDPDNDPLTYYDNTSIFNINPSNGFISEWLETADIDNHSILINVSDGITNVSMIFNLSVINNTAPVLGGKPLPDLITTEGTSTYYEFNATDADVFDTLLFTTTSSPSWNVIFNVTTTNNSASGAECYMSFTPQQADVGIWTITLNVTDNKGSVDTDTFTINITDFEYDPELSPIPNFRIKVNKTFNTTISATDEDGNLNSFGENSSMFNIVPDGDGSTKTGYIEFTPDDADIGENWVNITINDITGRYDWQLVLFNVTLNTPPIIDTIGNQTGLEDHLFQIQINATDPDIQDILVFSDNSTLFNISSDGIISFTPIVNDTGEYVINITVTDGESNDSKLMNLTIGDYNDYPFWKPYLNTYYTNMTSAYNTTTWTSSNILNYSTNFTVWNTTLYEKNLTIIIMDAIDEESPTLSFSVSYENFTNASNDTVYSGIELITMTSYDGNTAQANFTPNNSQVGVYYVNFTIDDGTGRINRTTQRLEIFNVNDAPIILNYTPNITHNVTMPENSSMQFNVTAIDIDYGDSLHYQWVLDNENITGANTSNYTYETHFFSAGIRNLTILVLDESNTSSLINWTINVTNVNRLGWFGQIRHHNYTHFNEGLVKTNVTVLPLHGGIILNPGIVTTGIYESKVLDSGETNYYHQFATLNWTGNVTPANNNTNITFDVYFQTRTAEGLTPMTCPPTISSNYTNTTYNASGMPIISDNERCIQYKLVMSTNNTSEKPAINSVYLGFEIADKEQEQNTNQSWIDLDTYFFDPDIDDNITFNVTTGNDTELQNLNITIDTETHKVFVITSNSFIGDTYIKFHMFDGYNTTTSNIIKIDIVEAETFPEVIIVPVGGGGSVSQPVPYEVPKYVATPVSFRLLAPQAVTTYANETMEIPINIFNSNFTMANLKLKASTPNKNVNLKLSRDKFTKLEPNEKQFVTLYVESHKTYGMYEILIEAEADATSVAEDGKETTSHFIERAKVFVNSLLKASGNESQVNTKLAFAEDLLSTNQECLELNEFLKKAKNLVEQEKTAEATKMLDQVIESCKYLVAPKELKPETEAPVKVYGMSTESAFILGTVALVTLIVAIALIIGWTHIKSKKKELTRKMD